MSNYILRITYPPKDIEVQIPHPNDEELVDVLKSMIKANIVEAKTIVCESTSELSMLLEQINRIYDAFYGGNNKGPFQISLE